jgi:signal transduction histidine kinase/CHASE2 domain-containing sensor protein
MNFRLRLALEWLLVGFAGTVLVLLAFRTDITAAFDNVFYDRLSSVRRPAADPQILLVNIDQRSLDAIGKWPWKRDVHAKLIAQMQRSNPRSIVLDVLLSEKGNAQDDAALASAIGGGASPVYLPLHFDTPGTGGHAYDAILPAKDFAAAARNTGQVNVTFDDDGKVRRAALCFDPEDDGGRWPHMMEYVYRGKSQQPSAAYRSHYCGKTLLLPYAARGSHREVSYIDALNGNVPSGLIAGRDIIIGASAVGMGDSYPVPYVDGAALAGSEIMANLLTAIRRNSFITPAPLPIVMLLSLLPMWLLLFGFLRWLPRTALVASLTMVALTLAGSALALSAQIWIPPGMAILSVLFVYPLWGWRRLQAMSDFMDTELTELEKEGEQLPLRVRQAKAGDLVGRQSLALSSAIDHMRDLRLFMKNTLSDLPDPMVATDVDGIVTLTSDLTAVRLNQSIQGLRLVDVFDKVLVPQYKLEVASYIQQPLEQSEQGGDMPFSKSAHYVRFQTIDGGTYVMRKSKIETASGALQGFIYYLADITALANAEAEREIVLQLLSHDMRAPQSAIIAALSGDIDTAARQRIESNARRTIKLAQDFVDIARMAESEFAGEDLLIADILRDVADDFWSLANERNIILHVNDTTDYGFVIGEADGLTRAFANLVDNAIKFSPAGGKIQIDIARIGTLPHSEIAIKITDSGDGIAPEILPLLFQRFATSPGQTGRIKGTGLGLNFVQAVIQRHQGTVSATNVAPKGTCFTIILPEALEKTEE